MVGLQYRGGFIGKLRADLYDVEADRRLAPNLPKVAKDERTLYQLI